MERRADVMTKRMMLALVFPLSVMSLMGLNGCDRQAPPPKAVKESPQVLDTAVGGMDGRAIEKAKGVETTLGQAGNRTVETTMEGAP